MRKHEGTEMGILRTILTFLRAFFTSRADLAAENMMLRRQPVAADAPAAWLHQAMRIAGRLIAEESSDGNLA